MTCRRPLLTLAVVLSLTAAGLSAPYAPPERASYDKILKQFADEFVTLTPGSGKFPASFTLGSGAAGAPAAEKDPVKVTFKRPFAMARYEVTQELYHVVMGKNPSKWQGPRNSVEVVSWDEANAFCAKVTALLRDRKLLKADEVIRLPSEAEWEYACRAGTTTAYSFGAKEADLGDYAWYRGNSKGHDPPVGKKKPNPWGLYDVHGYVWEWCADDWHPTHKGAAPDGTPRSVKGEKRKVVRSGSWADPAASARSGAREPRPATARDDRVGFRCVKAQAAKKE